MERMQPLVFHSHYDEPR
jgi:uncharacterized membrane protein